MPADPFDALRAPVVAVRPRRAYAADLRRRLARELGLDPTTGEPTMPVTSADPATYKPPAYHHITPYICVADSRRAIEWYGDVFGARLTHEPIVMDDGRVGHCEITIGDSVIQMADEFPEIGVVAPDPARTGVSLTLYVEDTDATYARALAQGATGLREPAEQFYGSRVAQVVDPFGHRWSISTVSA